MLANISWTDYIIAVTVVSIIYYVFVGTRYFSQDLKELLSGKRKLNFTPASGIPASIGRLTDTDYYRPENPTLEENQNDEFAQIEDLIGRLKNIIADAAARKADPQEFRQYLQMVFKEYNNLKKSAFRSSINELVVSECEKYNAVAPNEDEVDLLWDDAV
jgi:hypothetical protein